MKTKSSKKAKPKEESKFFETDFGDRKVSHVNQSRMIAIPKLALENLCDSTDGLTMAISLVQKGKDKFLKLIPIGIDSPKYKLDKKNKSKKNSKRYLITVANLIEIKGTDLLIKAFSKINRERMTSDSASMKLPCVE